MDGWGVCHVKAFRRGFFFSQLTRRYFMHWMLLLLCFCDFVEWWCLEMLEVIFGSGIGRLTESLRKCQPSMKRFVAPRVVLFDILGYYWRRLASPSPNHDGFLFLGWYHQALAVVFIFFVFMVCFYLMFLLYHSSFLLSNKHNQNNMFILLLICYLSSSHHSSLKLVGSWRGGGDEILSVQFTSSQKFIFVKNWWIKK